GGELRRFVDGDVRRAEKLHLRDSGRGEELSMPELAGQHGDQRLVLPEAGGPAGNGTAEQAGNGFPVEPAGFLERLRREQIPDVVGSVGAEERRDVGRSVRLLGTIGHGGRYDSARPAPKDLLLSKATKLAPHRQSCG